MDRIVTTREAAELLYGKADKSAMTKINKACRNGTITHCENPGGGKWFINATKEWPHLFDEVEPPDPYGRRDAPADDGWVRITSETTVGELVEILAAAAAARAPA